MIPGAMGLLKLETAPDGKPRVLIQLQFVAGIERGSETEPGLIHVAGGASIEVTDETALALMEAFDKMATDMKYSNLLAGAPTAGPRLV